MKVAFATDRLRICHWRDSLGDNRQRQELGRILTPEVTAHLPPSFQFDPGSGDIAAWLEARAAEADLCTVQDRTSGLVVGLLVLHANNEEEPVSLNIGYLFARSEWGRGLATELVGGLVDWCRNSDKAWRLVAGVGADNRASLAVLRKAGFEPAEGPSPDAETLTFELRI